MYVNSCFKLANSISPSNGNPILKQTKTETNSNFQYFDNKSNFSDIRFNAKYLNVWETSG